MVDGVSRGCHAGARYRRLVGAEVAKEPGMRPTRYEHPDSGSGGESMRNGIELDADRIGFVPGIGRRC
jgi:hypothetical protein